MNLKNKKYFLDLTVFILIFIFALFALSNLGFLVKASINITYTIISLLLALFYLFKKENFCRKFFAIAIVFFLSFVFANLFIDTSFDGRCYHFTLENLFKLGYNPIYDDLKTFANNHNMKILAEGVETPEELQMVIQLGCHLIQGFYTGRPNSEIVDHINENIENEIVAINLKLA
jgi:hypothetical protein